MRNFEQGGLPSQGWTTNKQTEQAANVLAGWKGRNIERDDIQTERRKRLTGSFSDTPRAHFANASLRPHFMPLVPMVPHPVLLTVLFIDSVPRSWLSDPASTSPSPSSSRPCYPASCLFRLLASLPIFPAQALRFLDPRGINDSRRSK